MASTIVKPFQRCLCPLSVCMSSQSRFLSLSLCRISFSHPPDDAHPQLSHRRGLGEVRSHRVSTVVSFNCPYPYLAREGQACRTAPFKGLSQPMSHSFQLTHSTQSRALFSPGMRCRLDRPLQRLPIAKATCITTDMRARLLSKKVAGDRRSERPRRAGLC